MATPYNSDWITFVFLAILLILGIGKLVYKERLFELLILLFSKKYLIKYSKDINLLFNGFNSIVFIAFIGILGLFGIGIARVYFSDEVSISILLYAKLLMGIGAYFLLRYLIGYCLAQLFELKTQQEMLSFVKMSYFFSATLLVLPFLLLAFFAKSYNLLLFKASFLFFTTLLIVRYINVFNSNKNSVKKNWFNFFLYLCALEIAPLLVILKMII